jgi:hypothetical protein
MRRILPFGLVILFVGGAQAQDNVKIPFDVVQAGFKKAECSIDLKDEEREVAGALGAGLVLVEVYCWRAAYQAGSIFFIVDPKAPEKARLAQFPSWTGRGKRSGLDYSLGSPGYDSTKKVVSMAHKGRGVGDCGTAAEWRWTGKDFVLKAAWNKDKCDGQPFEEGKRWQVYPPRR